jgi:hypothetical protein
MTASVNNSLISIPPRPVSLGRSFYPKIRPKAGKVGPAGALTPYLLTDPSFLACWFLAAHVSGGRLLGQRATEPRVTLAP